MTVPRLLIPEGLAFDFAGAVRFTPRTLSAVLAASPGPVALVTDGLAPEETDAVGVAIRAHPYPVVEVRLGRWDGFEHTPIGGLCRGVIAGFGAAGAREAVRFLESG